MQVVKNYYTIFPPESTEKLIIFQTISKVFTALCALGWSISKTVVDFFAGKREAETEKILRSANRQKPFKMTNNAVELDVPGRVAVFIYLCINDLALRDSSTCLQP